MLSDGLTWFNAFINAGCVHQLPVIVGRERRDLPDFKWVNRVLGNLKPSLSSCDRALAFRKWGDQYVSALVYRFNLRTLNERLALRPPKNAPQLLSTRIRCSASTVQ